ncbi:DUF4391 domain-containing protein [Salegentibacter sp. BDJ18]|uniref:DUF4391 domain-containing protein n=1 Tax=Salegentibacter sp. BDJ18 TaxID=2816376 RepID=UPI001AAF828C|nr:DUF4391 domain-containing protein [Salegentibacter sp. BDJ18]MBO2546009.1 DUF4391 domain-containing protein [Salegentibacter sp. BDJ18]
MALDYNQILHLPERTVLNKKMTKAFFLRNFDLSAAEKKLLKEQIESMLWIGNIKTANSNIPEVANETHIFKEVQVIQGQVVDGAPQKIWEACIQLFQKYIPFHILLIIEDETEFMLNAVDKRINQADRSRRTVEKHYNTPKLNKLYKKEQAEAFFNALAFDQLDKTNLETLYTGYINAIIQFQVASQTGNFKAQRKQRTAEDLEVLEMITFYEKEIEELRGYLKQEDQMSMRVEFNQQIQIRKEEIDKLKNKLAEV